MDNLQAPHKSEQVRQLIEARSCEVRFLAPYSPDLSPIEEAFSKIKGLLRKAKVCTTEALIEALGEAISVVTVWDARALRALWLPSSRATAMTDAVSHSMLSGEGSGETADPAL